MKDWMVEVLYEGKWRALRQGSGTRAVLEFYTFGALKRHVKSRFYVGRARAINQVTKETRYL